MIRTLFDERRRLEIRHAISTGSPIEFRRKKPELDEPDGAHSRLTKALGKLYGSQRYAVISPFLGRGIGYSDAELRTMRIQARMAKAVAKADENEKPKEVKPEESGKEEN